MAERQGRPRRYCSAACRQRAYRRRRRIPEAMQCMNRWVRFLLTPRGGKLAKVPIQRDGRYARVNDPSTWTSFRLASASTAGDGIGWVLGNGIGCIDLDDCIDDGRIAPWAEQFIAEHKQSAILIERSLSGRGIHIFTPMTPGPGRRIRDGRSIEIYPPDSGRYIAITGDRLTDTEGGAQMARKLKPCGTTAAARRHRRRGEPVCDACRTAERKQRAARDLSNARMVLDDLPETIDPRAELRFLYGKVRKALNAAEPKEVATLVKQGEALLEHLTRLDTDTTPTEQVDELTVIREERGALAV